MTDSTADDMGGIHSGHATISRAALVALVANAKTAHMVTAKPISGEGQSAVELAEAVLAALPAGDMVMIDWTVLRDVLNVVKAVKGVSPEATAPDEWAIEEAEGVLKAGGRPID